MKVTIVLDSPMVARFERIEQLSGLVTRKEIVIQQAARLGLIEMEKELRRISKRLAAIKPRPPRPRTATQEELAEDAARAARARRAR